MSSDFLFVSSDEQHEALTFAGRPLRDVVAEIRTLYSEDSRPWVVGFSGGKDSTAVLQLIYSAVKSLPPAQRDKQIFVVSSDTLVETPVVKDLLSRTLNELNSAARQDHIPISAHVVTPDADQTYWVNLLGKGYPAPTKAFRWCTERMKINPVNAFIIEKVASFGEVIVVLGARKAESSTRAQVIAKHRIKGSRLAKHTSLSNAQVYTPIEDWNADEVWEYLMSARRPWGGDNRGLLELYRGSNAGECPIVIDTSTPSCGNSRFGCWVCTVVTTDKAMESLVTQGESWMQPLLDFRNLLAETTNPTRKQDFRNYRRRSGKIAIARGKTVKNQATELHKKHIPGPYLMKYRQEWLERILIIQRDLQRDGRDVELITSVELQNIRREWLNDPIEPDWGDQLPIIYRRVFGSELQSVELGPRVFNDKDAELLYEIGDEYGISSSLVQKLLDLELSMNGLSKRRGMIDRIHSILNQDWEPLEEAILSVKLDRDAGYQEEIHRLQSELELIKDGGSR